jgi:branched-chain amino acid transport system permease protein
MGDLAGILLNALLVAGLYAAMSYGLALIYGVMKIINLAHAGTIMLGAFVTWTLFEYAGIDPFLAILVVCPLFFLLGQSIYHGLVRQLKLNTESPQVASLLLLFGVWMVMKYLGYTIWSGDNRSVLTSYTLESVNIGGIQVGVPNVLVFLVSVLALLVLQFVLGRTFLGRAIRAVSQNRNAAMLNGVDAEKIAGVAFGIGTAFAALAGALAAALYSFTPDFGGGFQLKAFVIIVLGGMESFTGVAAGALVVALVEAFGALKLPTTYQDFITFALLVLALVVLPKGLPALWQNRRKGVSKA